MAKSIIAVSDVHLGMTIRNDDSDEEKYEKYRESQFRDFLDTLDFSIISDFILLGDILDFWRHDHLNVIANESCHVDKLKEIKSKCIDTNFHYIAGNHDYHLLWLKENGADYPIEIKKSVEIRSKNEVFYFIHGYQLEVLSWNLYKSLFMYEEFCKDMCLVGEEVGGLADNLWKYRLERITQSMNSSSSPAGKLSPHKLKIQKAGESECVPESEEAMLYVTPKNMIEKILYKSNELLAQIEAEAAAQKLEETRKTTYPMGILPGSLDTIIEEIKKRIEDLVEKAEKVNDIIKNIHQFESELNPILPPEERIKPRETNVKQLQEEITELSNLKYTIEKYSESILETIKELSAPLYEKLSNYYKWIHGLVIPKNYFTIRDIAGSDARHYMFGIKKDRYLIYGHTHEAYIDNGRKVANAGCWGIQANTADKDFLYIQIVDDDVKVMSFIDKSSGSKEWKP